MDAVRQQPEQLPALVVELLRLMPPMLTIECSTRCDVPIANTAIPAGGRIYVAPGAANRDPARFEQPEEIRLHRPPPTPITFSVGSSAHRCLGEHLARLTAETVLQVLLIEFPPVYSAQPLDSVAFSYHTIWNDCLLVKSPDRLDLTFR
jgi:cytochrome P450